ncbi:T9SS type A sorting domain-containing protein [Psychroserpens jangbogonensis]|uniref:T9SS type A sorting domain-containing protein n=1 Tax=Psychroserpens jangbogonensis TaxID=1484460 RepID=UPI00068F0B8C|nr:T9SS type A sorting domain-containing protein [Psychroserpens jangbogonensis]
MKNTMITFRISLTIAIIFFSQHLSAQCIITYGENVDIVEHNDTFLWGQGFVAECNGYLEYLQLISNETGTVSAGNLNIYSGNNVNSTPIYTQSHPSITINNIGDPIRINITGTLNLTQDSQYTFEFTVNSIDVLYNSFNGYPGGTAFQDGSEEICCDFFFNVSIADAPLSIDNYEVHKAVSIFPNPSRDYITIMMPNLETIKKYSILNALGQEVIKGSIKSNEEIDIRNFMNGLYFMKFDDGNTLKFLKE